MCFCSPLSGNSWTHDFGDRSGPTADHAAQIENCPPPQEIKQLQHFLGLINFYRRFLPNCAQVLRPLADLLKGEAKMLEWTGGFPKCKTPPGGSGAIPTPCPKCWTFPCHWCLRYSYRRGHAAKILRPLAPWFFLPHINRHRIPIFNLRSWIIGRSGSIQTFSSLLRRSCFPALDRPQIPCYFSVTCFSLHLAQTTAPLGVYFRVQWTAFVSPRLKKYCCRFLIPPTPTVH